MNAHCFEFISKLGKLLYFKKMLELLHAYKVIFLLSGIINSF